MRRIQSAGVLPMLMLVACQQLPVLSQSGYMREVTIGDGVSDTVVDVQAGDEIRWTNMRKATVRIIFLDYVLNSLSCRTNFDGHFYSGAEAVLRPHERASLCFGGLGTFRYVIQRESEHRHGSVFIPGHVQVDTPAHQSSVQTGPIAIESP